ncbi:hypothetical protein CRE_06223 [Caenorhabditis remanei]|uniref:PAN-3 domain-containing protein n=1 Tax=Caenorhabditis remanei TaxID=31234 RepID=E3NRD4_CAERE|nr:hypothetical protein CRE_06223 [Caenorhabditis remanei]
MVTRTLFLEFCLIFSIFCYKPEISENVKMVVVYGTPLEFSNSGKSEENWADCLDKCWKQWDCVLVFQLSDGCEYFKIQEIQKVTKLDSSSGHKVGIKRSLPSDTCPRDTEPPPLFGNVSSTLIVTDGSDNYYKSEITYSPEKWSFNNSMLKCLTDIPEDYVPLNITEFPYNYSLTSPFLPGETFFMRGKTPGFNQEITIAFWNKDAFGFAIFIIINEDRAGRNYIEIYTYNMLNTLKRDGMDRLPNPYGYYTDFEIRVTSSETVATISFNGTEYEYELFKEVPLTKIDLFSVNYNTGKKDFQTGTVDFLGWTGDCWIFCYKPEISKNVKMVVVYGDILDYFYSDTVNENWVDCLDTCWKQWDCVETVRKNRKKTLKMSPNTYRSDPKSLHSFRNSAIFLFHLKHLKYAVLNKWII